MSGGHRPGEVLEFKVLVKSPDGKHVLIGIDDPEQSEYLQVGTEYLAHVTPAPPKP